MRVTDLVELGLPGFAVDELASRGITELEPLQKQAVEAGLLSGQNLIVMAPTSSGKTLIAELAALSHAIRGKGAVFITSLKALAYEKYLTFRESYSRPDRFCFHASIATGDEVTDESAIEHVSLTVATYEKWYYTLVERPQLMDEKSLVVIDELQMLGDPHRGERLEALLTWVKLRAPQPQIIGLSATFPNANTVAHWLNATLISSGRRLVPLTEEIWAKGRRIYVDRDVAGQPLQVALAYTDLATPSVVAQVAAEDGLPAIVFCVTKEDAERLAGRLAQDRQPRPECEVLVNELDEVAESNPTIRVLRQVLPKGLAFHNANLDHGERRLIEAAFRKGTIDLLCATPTLSAGVNLPAKTVVFDSCYRRWENDYISKAEYLNMAGRAGRRGLQESGRSILIAREEAEMERFRGYLTGVPEPVESVLIGGNLDRVILQAVASRVARSIGDVQAFLAASFHGTQRAGGRGELAQQAEAAMNCLQMDGMLTPAQRGVVATPLGAKVAASGVLPPTGALLFNRLAAVSSSFDASHSEQYERQVLLLAAACPDVAPSHDNNALLFAHWQNGFRNARARLLQDFAGLVSESDLEEPDRALLSALVAHRYISMDTFAEIARLGRYTSAANVRRLAASFSWMLLAAARVEDARGEQANPEFRRWLSRMALRLEYGASDRAVELLRIARYGDVQGLGRTRAERLAQKGFHDLTALLTADPKELVRHLDSWERVGRLREAVVRYLGDSSRHNQVGHANRASKLGKDARLINDFYDAQGTAFNRAALSLLRTVIPGTREQDVGDRSEPDLAAATREGLIVIECKAKKAAEGTVNLQDAFAVIGKSAHLKPIAHVTLGKPAFDRLPVERAANAGVCLVTHVVLCEAVVRIWEGALSAQDLIRALRQPGVLDKEDLANLSLRVASG